MVFQAETVVHDGQRDRTEDRPRVSMAVCVGVDVSVVSVKSSNSGRLRDELYAYLPLLLAHKPSI